MLRNYRAGQAPEGFRLVDLIKKFDKQSGGALGGVGAPADGNRKSDEWLVLFIAGMWFQDLWTYDFRRTEMCIIPYATQMGEISFCAYNTGVGWRYIVEQMHQTRRVAEWYKRARQARGVRQPAQARAARRAGPAGDSNPGRRHADPLNSLRRKPKATPAPAPQKSARRAARLERTARRQCSSGRALAGREMASSRRLSRTTSAPFEPIAAATTRPPENRGAAWKGTARRHFSSGRVAVGRDRLEPAPLFAPLQRLSSRSRPPPRALRRTAGRPRRGRRADTSPPGGWRSAAIG